MPAMKNTGVYSDLALERHHKNLRFDFYGNLLSEKQKEFFTLYHMEDFSLAEISEEMNITPQAVSDLLRRTEQKLDDYEVKLGLVQRHMIQADTASYLISLINKVDEPLRGQINSTLDALLKM